MKKNNIIRIKEKVPTKSYLFFIKIVKEATGLGLKDTKEMCDVMRENHRRGIDNFIDIPLIADIKTFQDKIEELDGEYIFVGGVQWERNIKMLSLGIGDKSDYIDFIQEYVDRIDRDSSQDIIKKIADKLSIADLEEIFSEINKNIKI